MDTANGVNPNKMPNEDELDEAALCVAAHNGNLPMIRLLLDHGADPNIHDGYEGSPLAAAKNSKQTQVIALLKQYGAKD